MHIKDLNADNICSLLMKYSMLLSKLNANPGFFRTQILPAAPHLVPQVQPGVIPEHRVSSKS